jgi:hypothetical protein
MRRGEMQVFLFNLYGCVFVQDDTFFKIRWLIHRVKSRRDKPLSMDGFSGLNDYMYM